MVSLSFSTLLHCVFPCFLIYIMEKYSFVGATMLGKEIFC